MQPAFYQRRLRPYNGFKGKIIGRLLMLIVAVLIGNAAWKFGEKQVARYQAIQQTADAENLLKAGQKSEALLKLRSALGIDASNVQANRLTARLLDEKGDPRAIEFYRFVVFDDSVLPGELAEIGYSSGGSDFFSEAADFMASGDRFLGNDNGINLSPQATFEDAEALARGAVRYGSPRLAREVAISMAKKWKKPEFPHLINASIHEKSGDFLAAEEEFRNAVSKSETPETLLSFAAFLLDSQDYSSQKASEASNLLERVVSIGSGPDAISALKQILSMRLARPERLPGLVAKYRELSSGNEAELQFADEIELGLYPDKKEKIFENIIARSAGASLPDRTSMALWFLNQKDPARAARVLPLEAAVADRTAFSTAIETLQSLKDWRGAEAALRSTSNPLEPHQSGALLAAGFSRSGDPRASAIWNDLLMKNEGQPEVVLELLEKAAQVGQWNLVLERLPSRFNDPALAVRTYEEILPVVRATGNPEDLINFHTLALKSRMLGGDPVLRNRAAFDRLMVGAAVSADELEERAKNFPDNPSMRTTRALSLFLNGSKSRALYEIEELEPAIDPTKLNPQERAVIAAILSENARVSEASKIASSIPNGSLTPQESDFLRKHLKTTADLD